MIDSGKIKITNDSKIIMQFSNYHHVIDNDTELCYKHQVDKVIAELKAENERLKATPEEIMKEVFDKVLIYPHDMVRLEDAYRLAVSLRKTKRALYKACAMWADRTRLICSVFGSDAPKIRWERMLAKCQTKAEEYK